MNNKDTIYIDVEDEITAVIDKVNTAKRDIVALVLPKRATVFQSIVNMRLLKRKADDAKKKVVLVTSEEGILPLAGVAGLHVAKTLQSEPVIPPTPLRSESPIKINEGSIDHADLEEVTPPVDKTKPVGVLAGLSPIPIPTARPDDDTIQVDNDSKDDKGDDKEPGKKGKKDKKGKSKDGKTKIPNFERFRLLLILGVVGLIILILLWILGFKVLPTANVIIKTKTSSVNSDLTMSLNSTATALDPVGMVVPAKIVSTKATATSPQVTTTGQKTIGSPATGTVTVTNSQSNCNNNACSTSDVSIPAGTVFTDSSGNFSYTSNSPVVLPQLKCPGNSCKSTSVNIPVTATQVGASYNINPTSFSSNDSQITGYPITSNQQMAGGSSSTEQVVAQADVTNAQGQITAPNTSSAEQQLEQQLEQAGLRPVVATFSAGSAAYAPSAAVGTVTNQITVVETITDTMYGVKNSDIGTLINNNVNQQINSATQSILDNGVSSSKFSFVSSTPTATDVTMTASATVGPKLNVSGLPKELAGMKSGAIQSLLNTTPGVTNVSVHYSPFWVTATPHNAKKIKITVEKSNGTTP